MIYVSKFKDTKSNSVYIIYLVLSLSQCSRLSLQNNDFYSFPVDPSNITFFLLITILFNFLVPWYLEKSNVIVLHLIKKILTMLESSFYQLSSITQSCPTLCDPMDCSTPDLPVHHQLPELTQTHVHWVSDAIQPSVVPFSSHPQSFPALGSFPMSQFFTSCGQSTGLSVSASVLPMNIKDWFPLGWTGVISL